MQKMVYLIGIDPSINSTGICIQKYEGDNKVFEDFIILTGERKLTKREKVANDAFINFSYQFYDKIDLSLYETNNHFHEYWKTYNMIQLVYSVKNIVKEYTKDNPEKIHIVIEGISYGSKMRTKSIFDLAGLNYLIRSVFLEKENIVFTICPPSEIKKFATGNGNCKKEMMIDIFSKTHKDLSDIIPKVDDICDAWFMSNYSRVLYKEEINSI